MTSSQDLDHFGRHPKLWTITAVRWVLKNPDYKGAIALRRKIEEPAKEIETTEYLEEVQAPDLDQAIAAAHELLDRHAEHMGEYSLEIWVVGPLLPHPDQERLGIRDYKVGADVLKQARAIGLRGRDLQARIGRMVRHAEPYEHRTANRRFGGIIMQVEGDAVLSIDRAVPPRRRRRKAK